MLFGSRRRSSVLACCAVLGVFGVAVPQTASAIDVKLTMEEAQKITNKDIADYLGGLPKEKMHCSVMGREALEAAISCYRGEPPKEHEIEGEVVCECFGVTEPQIRRAIEENQLTTVEDVTHFTKAGGGCERCLPDLQRILNEVLGAREEKTKAAAAPKKLTNLQRIQLVQKVIDEEIRPSLQADGGDLEILDVDGTTVYVSLRGTCTHCPSAQITLKDGVEDVYPGDVAQEWLERWRDNPKVLERELAAGGS